MKACTWLNKKTILQFDTFLLSNDKFELIEESKLKTQYINKTLEITLPSNIVTPKVQKYNIKFKKSFSQLTIHGHIKSMVPRISRSKVRINSRIFWINILMDKKL